MNVRNDERSLRKEKARTESKVQIEKDDFKLTIIDSKPDSASQITNASIVKPKH